MSDWISLASDDEGEPLCFLLSVSDRYSSISEIDLWRETFASSRSLVTRMRSLCMYESNPMIVRMRITPIQMKKYWLYPLRYAISDGLLKLSAGGTRDEVVASPPCIKGVEVEVVVDVVVELGAGIETTGKTFAGAVFCSTAELASAYRKISSCKLAAYLCSLSIIGKD